MSVAVLGLSCEGPGALPQGWPGWEGAGGLVRVSPGCEVPGSHCLQTFFLCCGLLLRITF